MSMLDVYYGLRPFLPRSMQIRLRRWLRLHKGRRTREVWPILESAGRKPEGWTGWPDGKQFALVLTHDVESAAGVSKCRPLMDVEESLGFRSSFNFVPEDYDVPADLRAEMVRRGFEIGVHGVVHDGRTFKSRKIFEERAPRINKWLKEWNAVGFRAPLMMHNLEWTSKLNIEYDSSTFDTDPFEPQPDGVGTIFPFWVDGNGRGPGYVELPYTLPQDFALFIIQQETTIDLWKNKLDWIAQKGGMALLDTHPDYMSFDATLRNPDDYPVERYAEFLGYVKARYADQHWHALPREVAREARRTPTSYAVRRKPKRVAMLAYAIYDTDNRIRRYAETLAQRGDEVDIFVLGRPGQPRHESIFGVHVHRIQSRVKNEGGQLSHFSRILRFLVRSCCAISWHHLRNPLDVVHVHSIPDFEVFAAWLPKLMGAKIILDIHDIVPEFYASKFGISGTDIRYKILVLAERISAAFANHVVIPNHLWKERLAGRTVAEQKITVIMNCVDPGIFHSQYRKRRDSQTVIIYPGGLQWHQGVDIAIRAFQKVVAELPGAEFHIYGEGNMKASLVALTRDLGMEGKVRFFDPVPVRQIAELMSGASLGVVAKRADSFGDEAYSTKIMEFMALGVPVVVSKTRIDQYYFDDSMVRFFEAGNPDALAEAMLEVLRNEEPRRNMLLRAADYASRNSWNSRKAEYLALIDQLCEPPESQA